VAPPDAAAVEQAEVVDPAEEAAATAWTALEAKLLASDGSTATSDELSAAWSDAAAPVSFVQALVAGSSRSTSTVPQRSACLRCLGDGLLLPSDSGLATPPPRQLRLATDALAAPGAAAALLASAVHPDAVLRKNAWRCVMLLLQLHGAAAAAAGSARVPDFGEVVASGVWVQPLAEQSTEAGQHAQFAAACLKEVAQRHGAALVAARPSLGADLLRSLTAGVDKRATAKFCAQALVTLAPLLSSGWATAADANAAGEAIAESHPKLADEAQQVRLLVGA